MRRVLLWCAQNTWLATHVPRWRFARQAVRRFLPGEGFDSALKAAVGFRAQNIGALFPPLGGKNNDFAGANKVGGDHEEGFAPAIASHAEISGQPPQLRPEIHRDA